MDWPRRRGGLAPRPHAPPPGAGWGRAFAAGSVLGLCWLVSYGYLAGGVLVGLLAVVPRLQEEDGKDSKDDKDGTGARETWRQGALRLVWLAAGAALPWIA